MHHRVTPAAAERRCAFIAHGLEHLARFFRRHVADFFGLRRDLGDTNNGAALGRMNLARAERRVFMHRVQRVRQRTGFPDVVRHVARSVRIGAHGRRGAVFYQYRFAFFVVTDYDASD